MQMTTLGIDIAKHMFQLHGVDQRGHVVLTKRLSRAKVLPFMAQ
jgi:transposase